MHSWLIKEKFNALESLFEENDIASIEQIKEATKNISLTPHIMVSVMILKQLNQYSII
jgi:hypothetical protein